MIVLSEKYTCTSDSNGWTLTEWRDATDKDGLPVRRGSNTYHATFRQVCEKIIDREVGLCGDIAEVHRLLDNAASILEGVDHEAAGND